MSAPSPAPAGAAPPTGRRSARLSTAALSIMGFGSPHGSNPRGPFQDQPAEAGASISVNRHFDDELTADQDVAAGAPLPAGPPRPRFDEPANGTAAVPAVTSFARVLGIS